MLIYPTNHFSAPPSGGGGSVPQYSIDFEAGSSQYLSMADASWGSYDTAKFAISVWVKRESTGSQVIFQKGSSSSNANSEILLSFSSDAILFRTFKASAVEGTLITSATYTSTSNWYHILVWYDSANATAGDRMRMWVDGSEVTSFSADTNPTAAAVNKSVPVNWGAYGTPGSYFDGLLYQAAFFSGSLPSISSVYNAGAAVDISGLGGLYSLLDVAGGTVTHDGVLTSGWTNNNSAVSSSTIP